MIPKEDWNAMIDEFSKGKEPTVPSTIVFPGDLVSVNLVNFQVSWCLPDYARKSRSGIESGDIGLVIREFNDGHNLSGFFLVVVGEKKVYLAEHEMKVIAHGKNTPGDKERKLIIEDFIMRRQRDQFRSAVEKAIQVLDKTEEPKQNVTVTVPEGVMDKLADMFESFLPKRKS